jgi:hypothetical protein
MQSKEPSVEKSKNSNEAKDEIRDVKEAVRTALEELTKPNTRHASFENTCTFPQEGRQMEQYTLGEVDHRKENSPPKLMQSEELLNIRTD